MQRFLEYWQARKPYPRIYWPVVIGLYTGMRRGEIQALRWDCVNFQTGLITVKRSYCRVAKKVMDQTKSKKIRRIPISATLEAKLKELKELHNSEFVLEMIHPDCFLKEFHRLCLRAGVPKIRFHDLRHTFASNFLMGRGNIYDLREILGHSTIQVTERYVHLIPSHLQGKTEVLGF